MQGYEVITQDHVIKKHQDSNPSPFNICVLFDQGKKAQLSKTTSPTSIFCIKLALVSDKIYRIELGSYNLVLEAANKFGPNAYLTYTGNVASFEAKKDL